MSDNAKGVPEPQIPPHTGTCGLEDAWVAEAVSSGKGLHHPIDLLGLARQPEAPQELPGEGTGLWAVGWVGTLRDTLKSYTAAPTRLLSLSCRWANLHLSFGSWGGVSGICPGEHQACRRVPENAFFFFFPEYESKYEHPIAHLSPITFCGPGHLSP